MIAALVTAWELVTGYAVILAGILTADACTGWQLRDALKPN